MSVVIDKFCPKCKSPIYYSGNYYCSQLDSGGCDWAMSERNSAFNDDIIASYLRQLLDERPDEAQQERLRFYLAQVQERQANRRG